MPQNPLDNPFPNFPEDIIVGPARNFVSLMEGIRESPPQAFWLSFITLLGNCVSRSVSTELISSEPRFYSVLLGSSAKTRKSTANNTARDLIRAAGAPKIIEGFGSTEGLLEQLVINPVCTLMLDEFNMLARKTGHEGTVGISALNALLESHFYDHPRANGNAFAVKDGFLSILGASTVEDFVKTWKDHHINTGFINRLLVVGANAPTKRISLPPEPDPAKWAELVAEVKGLIKKVSATPIRYPIATDAARIWDEFYSATIGDEPEWDRIDMYGRRLMTMQTLLKGDTEVSADSVREIVKFLNYEVSVRQIVSPEVADNPHAEAQQKILKVLRAKGPLNQTKLYRAVHAERMGTLVFKNALRGLMEPDIRLVCRDEQDCFALCTNDPHAYPSAVRPTNSSPEPLFMRPPESRISKLPQSPSSESCSEARI